MQAETQVIDPDPVLGQALAHFPSERLRPLIIAGVVIAPIALALGLTTAQITEWWGPLLTVVVMAVVGLVAGWYVLHGWNREIILYERGFSYREGSQTVFFEYGEIASIRLRAERLAYFGGLIHRDRYRFTVTSWQGDRFTITNQYRRAAELGTRLSERINRMLRPEITRRLAAGESVNFAENLLISDGGISSGGSVLMWRDFGGYRIGRGRLALIDSGGRVVADVPLPEVDNITLLIEILREKQASRTNPSE